MTLGVVENVSVLTKTHVTFGLVVLALFEFITAMYVFGKKGAKPHAKTMMSMHRIGGYVFLVFWLWPMLVGLDLLGRLSRYSDGWQFDGPRFYHAFLGVTVFVLLILKIAFVRFYPNFRPSARWLGIIISVAAVITWLIAGSFWLAMMGGRSLR
ncbi:MAG: hypothetical protein JSW27_21250 [Phycisphaerales bacterium]|nr:MAG: hypothetical protein JSW27_21250 [Phycisphaerales bacterium]